MPPILSLSSAPARPRHAAPPVLTETDILKAEIARRTAELDDLRRRLAQRPSGANVPSAADVHAATTATSLIAGDGIAPLAEMERRYILEVLEHFRGNRTHTARALEIGTNTLWRKLKAWGEPPAR